MTNHNNEKTISQFQSKVYPRTYIASSEYQTGANLFGAILGIPIFIGMLYLAFSPRIFDQKARLPLCIVCALFLSIILIGIISTYRFKITLNQNDIQYQGMILKKTMSRDDIKGWRMVRRKYLFLEIECNGIHSFQLQCDPDANFIAWFSGIPNREGEHRMSAM